MATAEGKREEFEDVLKSVINVLGDGQKGMAEMGEHLKDEVLKRYFLAESLKRAGFRGELEGELHRQGVRDIQESGTATGKFYRAWVELKAKLGGGDRSLLETAEKAEDETWRIYQEALNHNLPLPIRQMLAEQLSHILSSRDYVRDHRDALKAA
jgi:uncharacterized protein (TIGR02284 family)